MTTMSLEGHLGKQLEVDLCAGCQAFWFDEFESLQLAPGSTLKLMKFIGEGSAAGKPPLPDVLRCPRCDVRMKLARDMQRNTRFSYWRCGSEHGRFIGFLEFLKEKNFIRTLTPGQIKELRQNVQFVSCSNCGASVDLEKASACAYCRSPISMLDMKQPQKMLAQLKEAAERTVDPQLPMKLALARLETETDFAAYDRDPQFREDAQSSGLVYAGLHTVGRWLDKLIIC